MSMRALYPLAHFCYTAYSVDMDYRALALTAAVTAIFASFLTIVALSWWPAWFLLAGVWALALLIVLRPERDEKRASEPWDAA